MCTVSKGSPPFKFEWTKDHFPLTADDHVKIMSVDDMSVVTVESAGARNSGNYTCQVSNSVGSDSKTSVLIVKGKRLTLIEVTIN